MEEKYATVFSNQTGISARVCPHGHVYLHIGQTCLALGKDDFLDLAQVIRAAENHLLGSNIPWPNEPHH